MPEALRPDRHLRRRCFCAPSSGGGPRSWRDEAADSVRPRAQGARRQPVCAGSCSAALVVYTAGAAVAGGILTGCESLSLLVVSFVELTRQRDRAVAAARPLKLDWLVAVVASALVAVALGAVLVGLATRPRVPRARCLPRYGGTR